VWINHNSVRMGRASAVAFLRSSCDAYGSSSAAPCTSYLAQDGRNALLRAACHGSPARRAWFRGDPPDAGQRIARYPPAQAARRKSDLSRIVTIAGACAVQCSRRLDHPRETGWPCCISCPFQQRHEIGRQRRDHALDLAQPIRLFGPSGAERRKLALRRGFRSERCRAPAWRRSADRPLDPALVTGNTCTAGQSSRNRTRIKDRAGSCHGDHVSHASGCIGHLSIGPAGHWQIDRQISRRNIRSFKAFSLQRRPSRCIEGPWRLLRAALA